jgi:hypothetical protein
VKYPEIERPKHTPSACSKQAAGERTQYNPKEDEHETLGSALTTVIADLGHPFNANSTSNLDTSLWYIGAYSYYFTDAFVAPDLICVESDTQ